MIFAVGFGASTIGGEQERGLLDLILVNPVARRRVLLEKALALVTGVGPLATVAGRAILAMGAMVDLGVATSGLVAVLAGAALLSTFHGFIALLVGTATGNRAGGIAAGASTFAAGYLLQALAGLVSWLKPARLVSPLYYYNGSTPLASGLPVVHYLVLATLIVLVLAPAVATFERRDIVA